MEIIKTSFLLLSIGGVWKPDDWQGIKALLYYIYQYSIVFANHVFIVSGILALEFKNIDFEVLVDNLTLLMSMTIGRQKIVCFVTQREAIQSVIDSFKKAPFKPENSEEEIIATKFNGLAKSIFISYSAMIICSATLFSGSRESVMDPLNVLPFSGWFPYNYSTPKLYWTTTSLQLYGIWSTVAVDLAFDPLMSAIFCHLCSQIHILKYRFGNMVKNLEEISQETDMIADECKLTAKWVEYHIQVLQLVKFINNIFSSIIFVQYTVSSIILCTLAYLLSHTKGFSMEFVGYSGFLMTKSFQIFIPCFCADMLTYELLNVTSGVYGSNWFNLSNSLRKSVVIIMCKCHKPILITCSFFIVLTLESFTKIVKLAYTIFNVLQ